MESNTAKPRLFQRDFTLVVVGQIISLFGNSILRFALPLYLLRQTGSAAIFGVVSAISFLPMVLMSLVGGILADRANKRNIMVILDFSTSALVLLFTLLLGLSPLIPLMVATLLLLHGIQGTYQPAVQASIPALLAPEQVLSGNAIINQISALSGLVGPIVGGLLMGGFGITPILIVSIGCFLFSAIMETFIRMPHQPRQYQGSVAQLVRADLGDSFGYIRREKPILLQVMIIAALINLFLSAMLIVGLPVVVTRTLNLSDQMLGYCQGALAAGGLLGGLLVGLLGKRLSIGSAPLFVALGSLAMVPMGLVLLPGVPVMPAYITVTLCCAVAMSTATAASIQMLAFVQTETPPELVGKVISVLLASSMCAQPIGQAMYGLLYQNLAAWLVTLGAAAASLLVCLFARRVFREVAASARPHALSAPK